MPLTSVASEDEEFRFVGLLPPAVILEVAEGAVEVEKELVESRGELCVGSWDDPFVPLTAEPSRVPKSKELAGERT